MTHIYIIMYMTCIILNKQKIVSPQPTITLFNPHT